MSGYRSSSYSFVPWEYRILIALLLVLGGFYFTWEVILEDEPPQQNTIISIDEPPTMIPWRENPPIFLQNVQTERTGNPFFTQFPVEAPVAVVTPPVEQPIETTETLPTTPPPPPDHTLKVAFKGVRVSLTGKTFAILDIDDSETGRDSSYKKEGDSFANTFAVQSISEKMLVIKGPDDNTITELPFGEEKTFTLKANE